MSSIYCNLGRDAILSVICLAVGVFSPAWRIYSTRIDTQKLEMYPDCHFENSMDSSSSNDYGTSDEHKDGVTGMDIWMGLWTNIACYRSYDTENCATISTAELQKSLCSQGAIVKAALQKLMGDWLKLQIWAICLLCAGFGLICIYMIRKATEDRRLGRGLMAATSWFLTAIFIFAPVKQALDYNTDNFGPDFVNKLDAGVSVEFHTPWAIIVCGFGGAWAAVVAVRTVCDLRYRDQQPSGKAPYTLVNKSEHLVSNRRQKRMERKRETNNLFPL